MQITIVHKLLTLFLAILLLFGCPDPFDRYGALDAEAGLSFSNHSQSGSLSVDFCFERDCNQTDDGNSHHRILLIEVDSFCPIEAVLYQSKLIISPLHRHLANSNHLLDADFDIPSPPPNGLA